MGKISKTSEAKCKFATWVIAAQRNGLLQIDPEDTTVSMTVKGSDMFITGQSKDSPYIFIGIHESMMPWFLEVPWVMIDVHPDAKKMNMVAQMTPDQQLKLILHEGNGLCQWLQKVDNKRFEIPFKEFIVTDDGKVACSTVVFREIPFTVVKENIRKAVKKSQPWAQKILSKT